MWEGRSFGGKRCYPCVWHLVQTVTGVIGICLRLQVHQQLREELAKVKTLEGVAAVNQALKLRCQAGAGLREPSRLWKGPGAQVFDRPCAFAGGHV